MSIKDFIAVASEKLTPTERRIAELVLDDPTLLAFGTVSDLAQRADTSRPSIVRFATKLGFEGYTDLQSWIRKELSHQLTSPSHRIRQMEGASSTIRAAIEDSIHETFTVLDEQRLIALATPIAQARNIWILSGETSMAGAVVLHSGLSMIRADVHLVQEHSTGRELSSATDADTAVVFDFARYRRNSIVAAQALSGLGVSIVAITDGPLSPLASLTKTWCKLKIPAAGPFDSSIPVVLAAELLVAQVVTLLGKDAHDRIDRLEALWQATGTFLNYSPRISRDL
ncbi:MAG: MurR/RpiR family transcriptional regulator [Candidatus Marinimicrobia bacterium]|nr:MurR/RpiR family transcriptional regulator [Candidatus Neomarinimicrobiota bacterium]